MKKQYFLRLFILSIILFGIKYNAIGQNLNYLEFDGNNDYVKYTDDGTLGKMDAASNYTIESWIYPVSGRVAKYDRVLQRYYSFQITMFDGNNDGSIEDWYFVVYDKGTSKWIYYHTQGDATLTLNAWNHIAVINNATNGTLKLFVNGVDVTKTGGYSNRSLPSSSNNDNLYIGSKKASTPNNSFGGYIDEIRLKKTAENPANLHFHTYNVEYTSDANTAGLFHFNEGSGTTTINEASSTNATATLKNGTHWRAWNYIPTSILPFSKNTWNGSTSTDWATAANWSMNALPTSKSYVVVANVTNQPTIAGATIENCGNIDIEASAELAIDGTLNIFGDFTNNGSFSASGSVIYFGEDEQNVAAGTYNNLSLDNASAANCTFDGNTTVNGTLYINCDVTIPAGTTLDCNGSTSYDEDCILSNAGTIYIGGSFSQLNGGSYSNDAGLIVFDGSAAQTIPADDFYNIEIDNSNNVSLYGNASIEGVLTLTNGIITTTATKVLTINDGGSISGANALRYIDGPLAKVGSSDFIFPIGDASKYAPVELSNLSASETFTANYTKSGATNASNLASPLTKVSEKEYWDISRTSTASASVTLYWYDSKWSGLGNKSDMRIAHYNSTSSKWEAETGTYTSTGNVSLTTVESGKITVSNVSSFSPFTFGTTDNTTNPLPIELLSFDLTKNNNQTVGLNWNTASETNNKGFEIQRSTDAEHWDVLTFIKGAGNSNELHSYSFIDQQAKMANYYRLKQIDFDGAFSFSPIRFISFEKNIENISVFPNPTSNKINLVGLQTNQIAKIELYNYMGAYITDFPIETNHFSVDAFPKGIYIIRIAFNNGSSQNIRFIKE